MLYIIYVYTIFLFFVCVCVCFFGGVRMAAKAVNILLYIGITDAATQIVYIGICDPSGAAKKRPGLMAYGLFRRSYLGGGFKYFLFSPLLGEMIQFD